MPYPRAVLSTIAHAHADLLAARHVDLRLRARSNYILQWLKGAREVYGVEIDFRLQDATTVTGEFDHVVVDPPWGGRDYGALTLKDLPLVESLLDRAPSVHLKLPVSFQIDSLPRVQKVRPMMDDRLRFLWVTC